MSKPRRPEFFPKMKYRGRAYKRHTAALVLKLWTCDWGSVQVYEFPRETT